MTQQVCFTTSIASIRFLIHTEFFYSLDRNLEDVDTFYNKKYGDVVRRLKLLQDQYGRRADETGEPDQDEVEDLMAALLELRGSLRKLQWYGEVNRRGFIKITKKLDKKVPEVTAQRRYLESKVDPKPFATNVRLTETINNINDWLSTLGDHKSVEESSSTCSGTSTQRVSLKAVLSLVPGLMDSVDQSVREDNGSRLMVSIQSASAVLHETTDYSHQWLLLSLLQRCISSRSKDCIANLLGSISSLEEADDLNHRNCLHRLIISMSRTRVTGRAENSQHDSSSKVMNHTNYITPAAPPVLAPPLCDSEEVDGNTRFGRDDQTVTLLEYILDALSPEQRPALQMRDVYGRMPLHYAAQHGFVVVCQIIISHMQSWGQFEIADGIGAPFWQDTEGYTPVHLSVIGGHALTARILLQAEDWKGANDKKSAVRKHMSKFGDVLALATKSNFVSIVQLLAEAGVNLNYQDKHGETALHVAARLGHLECAGVLLTGSDNQKTNTEVAEYTFGWTPLFVACVDGQMGIVELLVKAGADLEALDTSGWTAKEHAALRGHMAIAKHLTERIGPPSGSAQGSSIKASISPPQSLSFVDRKSNSALRTTEPVKTFGHRYLTNESMVLVSLGTMDIRKTVDVVTLDRIPLAEAHSTQLDTALSLVVSALGASGEPSIVDLPVQDNISTDPIVFTAVDATKVKLLFDIVPTYAGSKDQIVGRGVALLSSIKPSIGSKRITLQGDVTVPITAAHTLEVIGSVNFNFLIITPFKHPNMSITETQTYWKSMTSTMVIGHRGDSPLCFPTPVRPLIDVKGWERTLRLERHYSLEKILSR